MHTRLHIYYIPRHNFCKYIQAACNKSQHEQFFTGLKICLTLVVLVGRIKKCMSFSYWSTRSGPTIKYEPNWKPRLQFGWKEIENFHLISERRFEILDLHSAQCTCPWIMEIEYLKTNISMNRSNTSMKAKFNRQENRSRNKIDNFKW